jgi:hypothetical protein
LIQQTLLIAKVRCSPRAALLVISEDLVRARGFSEDELFLEIVLILNPVIKD